MVHDQHPADPDRQNHSRGLSRVDLRATAGRFAPEADLGGLDGSVTVKPRRAAADDLGNGLVVDACIRRDAVQRRSLSVCGEDRRVGPGMMGPGPYGPGAPNNGVSPWQNGYPWPGMGMQRIFVVPSSVPAGPVSLRVHNTGALTHEVMVLPLNANQYPGQRAIGTNNQVDETGNLAEASRSCGADAGDGILAGATAWTTVNLPPGRYELLCNIAGHYGAGMYAELDAIGNR
jgi:hypothetical protein